MSVLIAVTIGLLLAWIGQDPRWIAVGAAAGVWSLPSFSRWISSSQLKLDLALAASAVAAYALGFRIDFIQNLAEGYWFLGIAALPISVGWVILVGRALRFVERQGGPRLTLQVAWVVCASFAMIVLLQPQPLILAQALSLLLLVGISWTLIKHPHSLSGKIPVVGLILSLITMAGMVKTSATVMLLAPILILGLPPLTLNQSLGIVTKVAIRKIQPQQWLSLYGLLSAVSVMAVTWIHQPSWWWLVALILLPGLALLLLGLPTVLPEQWAFNRKRIRLFNVEVDRVTASEAMDKVVAFVKSEQPHLVVTPDTTILMQAKDDKQFRRCYEQADLITPDGTGIVWASRWLGAPLPQRVTGIDLMQSMCEQAAASGWKVFLLGAQPGVVNDAAGRLMESYPGLNIVGTHHGYFRENEVDVIQQIKDAKPDLLFVGMGAPLQEQWLLRHKHALNVPVMMGVGGSFDVWAGRLKRAPRWMQKAGLEWVYRLLLEPHRVGRALQIPVFLLMVLRLKGSMWLYRSVASTTSASSN